jgi:diguanylate cyclase (GGDEF)-like protein
MGEVLQACRAVDETYDVIPEIAQQLFPGDSGALCIFSSPQNVLETVAAWGQPELSESVFTKDDCWALRRGKAHSVADAESAHICGHLPCSPPYGYVCVPMIAEGEVLGMLHLQWSKPDKSQTKEGWEALVESKRRLCLTVTEQFALALANLKLRETLRIQSIRDPLTGLYNRRHMEDSLEREARRADRKEKPLGVIMLDVDHFKQFNDTFGHDAGDHLLRDLGKLLLNQVRREDIPCRYGGEEFILILPESNLRNTRRRAEQIRELVKTQMRAPGDDPKLKEVTVSLGVAVYPDNGVTPGAVIVAADGALYEAKHNGRDRVEAAQAKK